jgi:uncharacterized protein YkwD
MKEHNFFSHTSPVPGKRTVGNRAKLAGTSATAENILRGGVDGPGAFWGWFSSKGHHENLLGAYRQVGIGYYDGFWTSNF